ncbi:hypothetical protein J6590_038664 [Homalodisca vitripennis]|nr:hypothetical protein J6590_038664 [Homalodisca vitripennis]
MFLVADGEVSHTYGPLDGSLYATVRSKKGEGVESAGGGGGAAAPVISSVHTVSMDSGISSAGNGLLTQPAPSYPDHHRALDELLSDMLLTVENIPDLPAATAQTPAAAPVDCRPSRTADHDIPYHARQDSRPFTYGSVPTGEMLRAQAGLSSPSLVRKASFKGDSVASSPVNGTSASVTLHRDVRRSNSSHSVPTARSPDFHEGKDTDSTRESAKEFGVAQHNIYPDGNVYRSTAPVAGGCQLYGNSYGPPRIHKGQQYISGVSKRGAAAGAAPAVTFFWVTPTWSLIFKNNVARPPRGLVRPKLGAHTWQTFCCPGRSWGHQPPGTRADIRSTLRRRSCDWTPSPQRWDHGTSGGFANSCRLT